MLKHAYIIVANSLSHVLCTCIAMLDDPNNDIFLLLDKKAKLYLQAKELANHVKYSRIQICQLLVNWGGYSQISAVLELLERVCSADEQYEYIHFFQGSDLPIKSKDEIRAFFDRNRGKEFVSIEYERTAMANNKCRYYHLFCHNRYFRKNRLVKLLNFGCVAIQKALGICKNTDIPLLQGSALFSITPQFAEYLIDHKDEIRRRFRFSLAADECFIQTMIMNSPFRERLFINEQGKTCNARLIDRTRPDGKNSPHVWRDDEMAYIEGQPAEMCFARKFDTQIAAGIVDELRNKYS